MIFGKDREKRPNSAVRQKQVVSEKNQGLQQRGGGGVEVGFLLPGNDKNNVINHKILSYF